MHPNLKLTPSLALSPRVMSCGVAPGNRNRPRTPLPYVSAKQAAND